MSGNGNGHGFTLYGKTPHGMEYQLVINVADVPGGPRGFALMLKTIDDEMYSAGFTRSDRLDKPAYGAGGRPGPPRPEEKPPAGLEVPEHCGLSMIYRPPKDASGDRKPVAARWECRKGKDCAEAEERGGNKYGATNWHLTKKMDGAPATSNGATAKPLDYAGFLTRAYQEFGYKRDATAVFAGVKTPDELEALGAEKWLDLLDKMKVVVKAEAPA